jgi:transposase
MKQEKCGEGVRARQRYTPEFKRSVVDHWQSSGKTAVEVAQEFGVNVWNLRDWRAQYGSEAKPVDAPLPPKPEEMAREIRQLRKELERVKMQRDILKKTMGILAESSGGATP